MQNSHLYLVVGLVLTALEIVVPGFVLLPIGLAAMAAAGVAVFTESVLVHVFAFVLTALTLFYALSKWNLSPFGRQRVSDQFGLPGKIGTLVELIESPAQSGRVKVYGDVFDVYWDDADPRMQELCVLELGARVRITRVVGIKVSVEAV